MAAARNPFWRRVLPWAVSAAALIYVFTAVDWTALVEATKRANMPLFVAFTLADKMIFFLWWGLLQAAAVRRFVTPVATRDVISVRGGAELFRSVNNPLADAVFFYGLAQLARNSQNDEAPARDAAQPPGSFAAIVAAAGLPFVCHFGVLLLQANVALFFLEGGIAANRDVATLVAVGWATVGGILFAVRIGVWQRLVDRTSLGAWLADVNPRTLVPFVGWFALLAFFDVLIQGLASRAFGVPIAWTALAARLPLLYIVLSIPSFGNFGTREIAWAACFAEFAPRETLVAYALATNGLFLLMHVAIGMLFLPRALSLVAEVRRARREGARVPQPLLHDASDP